MRKKFVSVVFDRKKELETHGIGKVELLIVLSRNERKYIALKKCTANEWKFYENTVELASEVARYTEVVEKMVANGEEMTKDVFDSHTGMSKESCKQKEYKKYSSSKTGFLDFMKAMIAKENLSEGTRKRKNVVVKALEDWTKLNRLVDVTERNVIAFDEWLHDGTRTTVTINNYHKALKMYTRAAYEKGYIKADPYESSRCHFSRGKTKERNPLTEDELVKVRTLKDLDSKMDKARDIFVFCAYTGLSYADSMLFDFNTMTELHNGTYFIDGSRLKTGSKFFTPILPPALKIMKKYDYKLPTLSNQKLNDYLHLVEKLAKIHKPMTSHVARHSFATLLLSYDIPIEKVSRMLGHKDIKTTQIYAKILKTTVERHANKLKALIR